MSKLVKELRRLAGWVDPSVDNFSEEILSTAADVIEEQSTRIKRMEEVFGTIQHMASDMQDPARQRGPSYPVDKAAREFHPERYRG